MQQTFGMGGFGGGMGAFALVVVLWGVFVTLFWMVCAWRAMRAHEKLADSIETIARKER
ncbi:MAG: hypothetical protein RBU21_09075 [FCB group bacterium]|jgi:hypothetical protein|nr:hypothetical protein [FCB group bacterium]